MARATQKPLGDGSVSGRWCRHDRLVPLVVAALMAAAAYAGGPVVIPPLPAVADLAQAPSFDGPQPIVATHYFYWYRWPDEHFFDDRQRRDDGLRQHFPDHRNVSYASPAWHRRQMEDLQAAGIDVALCVYWGAPNQYEKPDIRFSFDGLPALVQALDEMAAHGPTPRIGLFYDTSTLLAHLAFREPRDTNVDLRTDEGRDIFYRTVRDFFRLVPPRHWACLNGRPIVQLYGASFAAGNDQTVLNELYRRFAEDFHGRRPFVIAGPSWSFAGDAQTGWGAAIAGPMGKDGFIQIGPGYDDSPVNGRTTPPRDRLGGGFYTAAWLLALQAKPRVVIIETWDELHEGTGICETLEDGRFYIDLTRRFTDRLRAGGGPTEEDWAGAVQTLIGARSSNRQGREFASRLVLDAHVVDGPRLIDEGLRLCPEPDGVTKLATVAGRPALQTAKGVTPGRYVYFDVADPYYFDQHGTLRITFDYLDEGATPIEVQYDALGAEGLASAYRAHPEHIQRASTGTWKTATLVLNEARCANRQNGGADFRFATTGAELTLSRVTVNKLPEGYAD